MAELGGTGKTVRNRTIERRKGPFALSRQAEIEPGSVKRALVIRSRFLGDLCLTTPVLDHLRRHAPQAEIDYLAEAPYAPVLEDDPRIDHLLVAPRSATPAETWGLIRRLRGRRYDLALDLFCNPRSAVWTAASGATVRVGYGGKRWRSRAYTHPVTPRARRAVDFHLESLTRLGWPVDEHPVPRLHVSERKRAAARERWLQERLDEERRVVVLHPGAAWSTRRWPAPHFARLATLLLQAHADLEVRILAGPAEIELAATIEEAVADPRCRALSPMPVGVLPAFLERAAAFVGGDTGPLHVSAGVGTPTVGLFGRSLPEVTFPYPATAGHRAVYNGIWCSPCTLDVCAHLSCLWTLAPETVLPAVEESLRHGEASRAAAVPSIVGSAG